MSAKYRLGTLFDIRCGGTDPVALHHGSEIAQTAAVHGHFLALDADAKMSQSSTRVHSSAGLAGPECRSACVSLPGPDGAHYRRTLHLKRASLDAAQTALNRLRQRYTVWPDAGRIDPAFAARVGAEPNDDLNLPRALAVLWYRINSDLPPSTLKATVDSFDIALYLVTRGRTSASFDFPKDVRTPRDTHKRTRAKRNRASARLTRACLRTQRSRAADTAERQHPFGIA